MQFHLSYTDKERYENEERPEVQKQMLVDMAKKLPVYTRTGSGGQFIQSHLGKQIYKDLRKIEEFPSGPVVKNSMLPVQRSWV